MNRVTTLIAAASAWLAFLAAPAGAAPAVDRGFGANGVVAVAGLGQGIADTALAPAGKLVLVGRTADKHPAVVRLTRSGRVDRGFGTAGVAALPRGQGNDEVLYTAVATAGNGDVVAVGEATRRVPGATEPDEFGDPEPVTITDLIVARLSAQGQPDGGFGGGDGFVQLPSQTSGSRRATAAAVAIHDGRIVIAGTDGVTPSARVLIRRLLADGAPDVSFAGDGELTVKPASGRCGRGGALAIRRDGRIVVGHTVDTFCQITEDEGDGGFEFGVLALRRDGSPDTAFSGDGQAAREIGDEFHAGVEDVTLMADGGVAAVGFVGGRLGVLRLKSSGTPDRAFGDRGAAILEAGPVAVSGRTVGPARVFPRSGGGLLVIGHTAATRTAGSRAFLAGVGATGGLDGRFAPKGVATFKLGMPIVTDAALVNGGRAVLVAGIGVRSGDRGRLARVRLR